MENPSHWRPLFGLTALLLSALACRPVMTIGWQEIIVLVAILLVLMGPPLFRLYKRFDEYRNWRTTQDKDHPED
jgi:hypothetical protein